MRNSPQVANVPIFWARLCVSPRKHTVPDSSANQQSKRWGGPTIFVGTTFYFFQPKNDTELQPRNFQNWNSESFTLSMQNKQSSLIFPSLRTSSHFSRVGTVKEQVVVRFRNISVTEDTRGIRNNSQTRSLSVVLSFCFIAIHRTKSPSWNILGKPHPPYTIHDVAKEPLTAFQADFTVNRTEWEGDQTTASFTDILGTIVAGVLDLISCIILLLSRGHFLAPFWIRDDTLEMIDRPMLEHILSSKFVI